MAGEDVDAWRAEPEDIVTKIVEYDYELGQIPENLVLLSDGTVCVTLVLAGAVWFSNGVVEQPVPGHQHVMAAGIVVDAEDRIYVALRSQDPDVAGIWRRENAQWTRFAAANTEDGLNGIAFDTDGVLFAADSVNGRLLFHPPGAAQLQVWLDDPCLKPEGPEDPIRSTGVNGIKFHKGDLFASNSAQGTFLRIATSDGVPGAITKLISGYPIDDFALDSDDVAYLAVHPEDMVVRVAPDTREATILGRASDGLDGPTAIAITSDGLVVTNLGMLGERHLPSLVHIATDVGKPSLPRPSVAR